MIVLYQQIKYLSINGGKMKKYSVAIIGCGSRGCETYADLIQHYKDRFEIVSLCDINEARLKKYGERFAVSETNRFTGEDTFFAVKRADLIVIATPDRDHIRHCVKALSLGYNVLLEKPISDSREELESLLSAQKKYGGKVLVCHVLRYAPAYVKVAELLQSGIIGRLVAIQSVEQVAYWHQAHSYVRGIWRNTKETAPMILAKCCHDLDLLQYYANSACESLTSVGDLTYFKEENAPEGSAKRCLQCKLADSCPYSAKEFYIKWWKNNGCPEISWPQYHISDAYPMTEEALVKALEEGPYGRCVYHCDNDAVDHQFTQMTFKNGVKASLLMTAFTKDGGRAMRFFGTLGEIEFREHENYIDVRPFTGDSYRIDTRTLKVGESGHGGGDGVLIDTLYNMLGGATVQRTSLEESVESHLMAICAEQSRLLGGELVYVHK